MAAKDRLTPKNSGSRAMGASLNVQTPPVKVRMPAINVPEIKIPEIKIPKIDVPAANVQVAAADMGPVADAIKAIGGAIVELGEQQVKLAQQQADLIDAIRAVAAKPAATPKRPKSYTVDFDKEGGETVGMTVKVG